MLTILELDRWLRGRIIIAPRIEPVTEIARNELYISYVHLIKAKLSKSLMPLQQNYIGNQIITYASGTT